MFLALASCRGKIGSAEYLRPLQVLGASADLISGIAFLTLATLSEQYTFLSTDLQKILLGAGIAYTTTSVFAIGLAIKSNHDVHKLLPQGGGHQIVF